MPILPTPIDRGARPAMPRLAPLATCLTLGLTVCLLAPAADPPAPEESQAAFEPGSGPGPGQAYLARFAGDWDVVKTFYPREGGPTRVTGRCRQEMIHKGRFLRSEFTFDDRGGESTGMGLIGFEPGNGLFTSVWTDSRQTAMSQRRSRDPFDGREIVLHSKPADPPDPKAPARCSRTVSRLEDGDRTLTHRQYNVSPDGSERLFMELKMARKKKPAVP